MGNLAVCVLAGGEGLRMGGAKPQRLFAGMRLVDRALAYAWSVSDEVAVAVRSADQVGDAGRASLVFDAPGIPGPLAGLSAGLAFARIRGARRLLCVPCDMPLLPLDLAERLSAALGSRQDAAAAAPVCAGELHPACALWKVEALDCIGDYVETGCASLRGFARRVGLVEASFDAAAMTAFANVNTPGELERLEGLISTPTRSGVGGGQAAASSLSGGGVR